MWTPEELEEMRRADAEIEEGFCLTNADLDFARAMDREAYHWSKDNRERMIAAQKKAWYEANREKVAAQQKAYREANREKYNAYMREYMAKRKRAQRSGNSN